ncbi:exo-alpha-sialidase [Candidatus Sumerlaeota bacterium]|nr:exo-alpha-sialidase [Candidatus Sumerlaeota bacterium]
MEVGLLKDEIDKARSLAVLREEFIYDTAPFPSCHASTVVETEEGLVCAFFGGTHERHPDVAIWVSRQEGSVWIPPFEAANGVEPAEVRYPCWNPVLSQIAGGPLLLFYKVGPSPSTWWGMMTESTDGGRTWSEPWRLPEGILGPIKNKPIQLRNGDLLCPSSVEDDGWRVHFERTADAGRTWERTAPVNDGVEFRAIQPAILVHPDGRLQALCRTKQDCIAEVWSEDEGRTWGPMRAIALPNPDAGFDAVSLSDERYFLIYNHTVRGGDFPQAREMLNVAVSDDGRDWKAAFVLEKGEGQFSYPAAIQTSDGMVHTTYTYHRRTIKHAVIDPSSLGSHDMPDGRWPD